MKKRFSFFIFCLIAIACFFWFKQKPKAQYTKLAVHYQPYSTIPAVEIALESKRYLIELDTGASDFLFLRKQILDELKKEEDVPSVSFDIHGNQYTRSRFVLPMMQLGDLRVSSVPVAEEVDSFLINAHVGADKLDIEEKIKNIRGRLGIQLFEKVCLLLDLPDLAVYIGKNLQILEEESKISFKTFTEIPSAPDSEGAIFIIETNKGPKRVMIDTGAEISLWHDSDISDPYQFVPVELLLDTPVPYKFVSFNLESFNVDAILGIDFLKNHKVCIDLKNKRALLSPPIKDIGKSLQ